MLDVKNLKGRDCLTAQTSNPADVQPIPQGAGTALTDVIDLTLPAKGGNLKICFAIPPGEKVKIYSSQGGSCLPVKTQVKKGIACAEIKKSGGYTLIGK